MNCEIVVQTECCKNNCQTEEKHDNDEYEEEKVDEEEIDDLSNTTIVD